MDEMQPHVLENISSLDRMANSSDNAKPVEYNDPREFLNTECAVLILDRTCLFREKQRHTRRGPSLG